MPRVLCVWFPRWPIQRLRVAEQELKRRPLVLYREQGQRLHVTSCCPMAAKHGVGVGQSLAEAKAILPHVLFQRAEPAQDQAALRELALAMQTFTPLVGLEESAPPESLLADVTGCPHLWGGERRFLGAVSQFWRERQYIVRLALADTIGTAWAVAHCGEAPALVPSGREPTVLSGLPVAALRLPATTLARLDAVGLSTVRDVMRLPREDLKSRFGSLLWQRLSQALGTSPELLVSERLREPIQAAREFEYPLTDQFAVGHFHRELIRELLIQADRHGAGLQELNGEFQTERESFALPLRLTEASQDERHILELISLQWERQPRTSGMVRISWTATRLAPMPRQQRRLFDDEEVATDSRLLVELVDRLGSRLGETAVLRVSPVADAQPEQAVSVASWAKGGHAGETFSAELARHRPLRLLRSPLPLLVTSVVPDGPPMQMFWQGCSHRVLRQWGPERIETGWWRKADVRRDYYRVEWDDGTHVWAFRERRWGTWFLHGFFD